MSDTLDKIARRIASGSVRTAGKIEFVKDQGPVRRDVRVEGFDFSADALRNLAKIHWAIQRSHSYAMAALRLFSKMPSSQFSPDGLLGGRGYIQGVKEMRAGLSQAVETLSSFTDTVYDEINADHWGGAGDGTEVAELVQDAEQVKADPEAFVEQEYEGEGEFQDPQEPEEEFAEPGEGEEEPIENPLAEDYNPQFEQPESDEEDDDDWSAPAQFQTAAAATEPGSELPTDDTDQKMGKSESEMVGNTTTPAHGNYASSIVSDKLAERVARMLLRTASENEPALLPGPRVEHIGPGVLDLWSQNDALTSGVNESEPLYEDWGANDGVTGYDDAETGDSTVLKTSAARVARECYSWLPGANNDRNLNYYERGLSDEDVAWMRQNAAPEMPPELVKSDRPAIDAKHLWEVDF